MRQFLYDDLKNIYRIRLARRATLPIYNYVKLYNLLIFS